MKIKTGDLLTCGTVYRASTEAQCGELKPPYGYLCTALAGHELGDVPHIACGRLSGVVAIWDATRVVYLAEVGTGVEL